MSSVEIVPILSGFLLGAFLGWIEPASRKRIGVPIALALVLFATLFASVTHSVAGKSRKYVTREL